MTTNRLTKAQRKALELLQSQVGGVICSDDERCQEFSDDQHPTDTWNQLFQAGLAKEWGPGWSGDDFTLNITDAGRAALQQENNHE